MPSYRFYVLDDADHFIRVIEESAGNDDEARNLVKELAEENPVEIWSGARKIGRFDRNQEA